MHLPVRICSRELFVMPLAIIPVSVGSIVFGIGFVPMILIIALVGVGPFVVMERELHIIKMHPRIGVPAVTVAIACGVG